MSRGERRVGIVDRLVLADEAAQFGRQRPRARLQRRVLHHFVGLHRAGGGGDQQEAESEQAREAWPSLQPAPRAAAAAAARRRRRAEPQPTVGERQRAAERHQQAPSQISVTSGFQ